MTDLELSLLRTFYADVLRGFSIIAHKDSTIYVKHFTSIDQANVDEFYKKFYDKAISKKLPSEKEKLDELIKDELWSIKDENEIENNKKYIDNLYLTKKNLMLQSQIKDIERQITEGNEKLYAKIIKRKELMGLTAESFANKKLNEHYIYKSFYKNEGLTEAFFGVEEYDDFEAFEIGQFIRLYNEKIENFSTKNIQKIALAAFFQNVFALCGDNTYYFYCKPIAYLTYFQTELLRWGNYFKHILSDQKVQPPPELMEEPEKLINWFTGAKNAEKLLGTEGIAKNSEGGAKTIFTKDKSDLKALGVEQEGISLNQLAKGKKTLSMEDLMKAHGIS